MEHIDRDIDFVAEPIFSFGKLSAVNLCNISYGTTGEESRVEISSSNDKTVYNCTYCKNTELECFHIMAVKQYLSETFSSQVLESGNNEVIDNKVIDNEVIDNYIVTPVEPITWFSKFYITNLQDGKATEVKTIDIYTYKCSQCENSFECCHTKRVTQFMENRLDDQLSNH
jgi:hypothetical protein